MLKEGLVVVSLLAVPEKSIYIAHECVVLDMCEGVQYSDIVGDGILFYELQNGFSVGFFEKRRWNNLKRLMCLLLNIQYLEASDPLLWQGVLKNTGQRK